MELVNNVKQKLAKGELVSSMAIRLVRTIEIVHIAKSAGFDSIYIDMEHNAFTVDAASQICIAALACGIAPFVRVPASSFDMVSRLLDGGALGIIAPHLQSVEDVRRMVDIAKFPPIGKRGAVGNLPQLGYRNVKATEANPLVNDATMVIGMVETVQALQNIDQILAVEGLDMVLVGTNDLTAEMGIPGQYDHSSVTDAYAHIIKTARKYGKHVGVGGLASRPDLVEKFVQMGAHYVSTGTDLGFLVGTCASKAQFVANLKRAPLTAQT